MKLKKLIITFFLLPAAFGYAQTQSTQIFGKPMVRHKIP